MRWLCILLTFALLTLPVVAEADELDAPTEKMMSEDDNPPVTRSSFILKRFLGRVGGGDGRRGKYNKIKIRIRLYEFAPNKDGVRHRLEMRPRVGDKFGLEFIYRF